MHSFEENLRTQEDEILSRKTRYLEAARGEDFVFLACTVLIQITSVKDRQTDRQIDKQTPRRWLRRAKHSANARNNNFYLIFLFYFLIAVSKLVEFVFNVKFLI